MTTLTPNKIKTAAAALDVPARRLIDSIRDRGDIVCGVADLIPAYRVTVDAHCGTHFPTGMTMRQFEEIRVDASEAGAYDVDPETALDPDCIRRTIEWIDRIGAAQARLAELPSCEALEQYLSETPAPDDWDMIPEWYEEQVRIAEGGAR